jgi:hypothetical protein
MSSTSTSTLQSTWFEQHWKSYLEEWYQLENPQAYDHNFVEFVREKWGEYNYQKMIQKK